MGLSCLGDAAAFQLNAWKRHPYSDCYVALTLPDTVSSSDLKYKVTQENGAARSVSYQYEGIEVGSSRGSFYPINAPARSMFSRTAAVGEDTETQESNQTQSIQIEGLDDVFAQTSAMFRVGYAKVRAYAQSHMMLVIAGCAVLLVLILVFIVILIFRCTSDCRLRRRRKQEEKERRRREEEIERMTTAEIEAELRAHMEEERIRKEQEKLAQAEAERAAGQAGEPEKAHKGINN